MKLSEVIAAFEQVLPNLVPVETIVEGDVITLRSDGGHEMSLRRDAVGVTPIEIDYDGCGDHSLYSWNGNGWDLTHEEISSDDPNLVVTGRG